MELSALRSKLFSLHRYKATLHLPTCLIMMILTITTLPCCRMFQEIVDDKSESVKGEDNLAALTAGERVPWAKARKAYFSTGVNKASLSAIEKGSFVLVLDDEEYNYSAVSLSVCVKTALNEM